MQRAFQIDWGRVVAKERFQRLILKAAKGDEDELQQVMLVVKKYYGLLADAFEYYGTRLVGGCRARRHNSHASPC